MYGLLRELNEKRYNRRTNWHCSGLARLNSQLRNYFYSIFSQNSGFEFKFQWHDNRSWICWVTSGQETQKLSFQSQVYVNGLQLYTFSHYVVNVVYFLVILFKIIQSSTQNYHFQVSNLREWDCPESYKY